MEEVTIKRLRALAHLLDTKFQGPMGIKFGLDGILGFIPVVGDFVTSFLSFYILIQAANLGCRPSVLIRMALNLVLENVADSVPILGNFFDIYWKSNIKNLRLLEQYQREPQKVQLSSRLVLFFLSLILIIILIGVTALSLLALKFIWDAFK